MSDIAAGTYVGQVERDPDGVLWAVLYCGGLVISREPVRSLRRGKRRVADLVLGASDSSARESHRAAPIYMNRLVERRSAGQRHRHPVPTLQPAVTTAHSSPAPRVTRPALAP